MSRKFPKWMKRAAKCDLFGLLEYGTTDEQRKAFALYTKIRAKADRPLRMLQLKLDHAIAQNTTLMRMLREPQMMTARQAEEFKQSVRMDHAMIAHGLEIGKFVRAIEIHERQGDTVVVTTQIPGGDEATNKLFAANPHTYPFTGWPARFMDVVERPKYDPPSEESLLRTKDLIAAAKRANPGMRIVHKSTGRGFDEGALPSTYEQEIAEKMNAMTDPGDALTIEKVEALREYAEKMGCPRQTMWVKKRIAERLGLSYFHPSLPIFGTDAKKLAKRRAAIPGDEMVEVDFLLYADAKRYDDKPDNNEADQCDAKHTT